MTHQYPNGVLAGMGDLRLYSSKWGVVHGGPLKSHWQRVKGVAKQLHLSRDARKRLEWMCWYETKGTRNARATCRHFGIAPKVFYYWRKRYSPEKLYFLEDRSHRPLNLRKSTLTSEEELRIIALRKNHIFYSKMKIAYLYREKYGVPISSWKVQKVIEKYEMYVNIKKTGQTAAKRRRSWHKRRITNLMKKPRPGFLFCLDTIVRFYHGQKRYILTGIDCYSRLAFARMYDSHSSLSAADFLFKLDQLVVGQLVHIQTDNGSEFHLNFDRAIKHMGLTHWWSRVKTPKDNAICERFNRTLQEEFINAGNATADVDRFNHNLSKWLIEYDFHRPHAALGYRRPIEVACPDPKALPIYSSRTGTGHVLAPSVASPTFIRFQTPLHV